MMMTFFILWIYIHNGNGSVAAMDHYYSQASCFAAKEQMEIELKDTNATIKCIPARER